MQILRAEGYATVPWRNGGGTTREIAALYDKRRHDDFLWRLSIATIERSGPFSTFEGVDRTIALLGGHGMHLVGPSDAVLIDSNRDPFAFVGENPVRCELVDGSTVDLNAMSRRDHFGHTVRRERVLGWLSVVGEADTTYVVANATLELAWRGRATLLPFDTVADIHRSESFELYTDEPGEVFIVELTELRLEPSRPFF